MATKMERTDRDRETETKRDRQRQRERQRDLDSPITGVEHRKLSNRMIRVRQQF